MAEDLGERTEPATQRRRERARDRGQIVTSRDLSAGVVLLAVTVGFHAFGENLLDLAAELIHHCLTVPWLDLGLDRARVETSRLMLMTLRGLSPFLGSFYLAAFLYNFWQAGGIHFASEREFFNFSLFNPTAGLERIFSLRGLVKLALDVAKVTVVGMIVYNYLMGEMPALTLLGDLPFPLAAAYAFEKIITLAYYLASLLIVMGLVDYAYQAYQFEQDMRMTKQEVKEEHKDIEGDPQIKRRRRQIHFQIASRRMMARVPQAQVVITNPTELAIAIEYRAEEMEAPVIVAKGADLMARKIREIAALHHIPIIENKPLARMLFYKAEVDRVIPEESFVAIAEILAYVYRVTGKKVSRLDAG